MGDFGALNIPARFQSPCVMKQCLKEVKGGPSNISVLVSQTHCTGLGLGQFASGAPDRSAEKG